MRFEAAGYAIRKLAQQPALRRRDLVQPHAPTSPAGRRHSTGDRWPRSP
jgi:hypothetical protein